MSVYKHKMVNGQLVDLTPEEIAELEERDRNPPPPWWENPQPRNEDNPDAKRRP